MPLSLNRVTFHQSGTERFSRTMQYPYSTIRLESQSSSPHRRLNTLFSMDCTTPPANRPRSPPTLSQSRSMGVIGVLPVTTSPAPALKSHASHASQGAVDHVHGLTDIAEIVVPAVPESMIADCSVAGHIRLVLHTVQYSVFRDPQYW